MEKNYFNKTMGALKTMFAGLLVFTALSGQAQCVANFAYTVAPNGVVHFQSTSTTTNTAPLYIQWTYGDGNSGVGQSPTHTFLTNGSKGVCVYIADSVNNCFDAYCDSIFINSIGTSTTCSHNVSYSMSKDSVQALTWNAYPTYPSNVSNATWTWGDGTTSTGLYPSHTYSAAGTYSTCVTVSVTCDSLTGTYCYVANIFKSSESNAMIQLNVKGAKVTGVAKLEKDNDLLTIYPNPTTGFFTFELSTKAMDSKQLNVSVYNMLGEKVYEQNNLSTSKQTIDVSSLSAGTYFVKVLSENGLYTKKIMVQK